MKKPNYDTMDDFMYHFLLKIIMAAALAGAIFYIAGWKIPEYPCVMRKMTGLYCPGCGGTRAFLFLIHGKIGMSLFYHPVVCYAVTILSVYMITQTIMRTTKRKVSALHFRMGYCYIGAAILIGNFLWKNYYVIEKGIYLIP
ncbi:MAG: DUF2752 domain-containing protein [Candidatus Fimimorpha sp.]